MMNARCRKPARIRLSTPSLVVASHRRQGRSGDPEPFIRSAEATGDEVLSGRAGAWQTQE